MGLCDRKWITLNVGGTIFMTSRSTLTKSTPPSSPLRRISGNSTNIDWDRDDTGAYLIDRDPTYFQPVLNYLRHGRLVLPHDVPDEAILVEAEYFNLPELAKLVKQRMVQRQQQHQQQLSIQPPRTTVGAIAQVAPQQQLQQHQQQQQQQQQQQPKPLINSLFRSPEFLTNYVNNILADV